MLDGLTSSVASDAAAAIGFPPNVFECLPLSGKSISAGYTAAPIGTPPPMDFAIVRMSGTAFECSMAHIFPVRPNPVWTSSSMRRRLLSFAIFAIRSIQPGGGTMYPPSPCTGSTKIAATSSGGATVFMYVSSMMFAQYRSQDGYVSL